jgi:hypothetical protein
MDWTWHLWSPSGPVLALTGKDTRVVAEIGSWPPDERVAIARLVAAAPALLAALKVIVLDPALRGHLEAANSMALWQALDAVAKAEG